MRGFVQSFKISRWISSQISPQNSVLSKKIRQIATIVLVTIVLMLSGIGVQPTLAATPITDPSVKATPAKSTEKPSAKSIVPKAEASIGEKIFTGNCAACHIGGNNVILAEKNLSKDALEKYAMNSVAAIKTQVTGGKNAMPAFGENLTSAEIEAVARYVITQSQLDWKGSSVGLQ